MANPLKNCLSFCRLDTALVLTNCPVPFTESVPHTSIAAEDIPEFAALQKH